MDMLITLHPMRADTTLTVKKDGGTLILNGEAFDLSPLPEGGTLPSKATGSEWIVGPIERISGTLHITLRFPHGPNPPQNVAYPSPIVVTQDGDVELPK